MHGWSGGGVSDPLSMEGSDMCAICLFLEKVHVVSVCVAREGGGWGSVRSCRRGK